MKMRDKISLLTKKNKEQRQMINELNELNEKYIRDKRLLEERIERAARTHNENVVFQMRSRCAVAYRDLMKKKYGSEYLTITHIDYEKGFQMFCEGAEFLKEFTDKEGIK